MTKKDEEYLFDTINLILEETHENNIMLKLIIRVINTFILNHNLENGEDFLRNVLANLVSR